MDQTELVDLEKFKGCIMKLNDAEKCHVGKHARGQKLGVCPHEKGWKNVYKLTPGSSMARPFYPAEPRDDVDGEQIRAGSTSRSHRWHGEQIPTTLMVRREKNRRVWPGY